MQLRSVWRVIGLTLAMTLVAVPSLAASQGATPAEPSSGGADVVINGLTNPRGFTWGADGTLYLAQAGTAGDLPVLIEGTPAPFFGGKSSSIVTVENGCATPLAEGLPSGILADAGWVFGVMDVVILDGELYALSGGGSPAFSQPESPNGVYRVLADGSWELVADLGAWFLEHPPEVIAPEYQPFGSLFDMEAGDGQLWVSEALGGRLLTVTPDGQIELKADLSEGHLVPTGVALDGEGGAYVGFETVVPYPDGASKVVHVAADGSVTDYWTGLTAVTDVVMGPDGVLYAAEMATNNLEEPPFLNPGSGRIVRQTGPDSLEAVVTGINYPVYMGFGPDGALYVDGPAFDFEDRGAGQGWLVRFDLSGGPVSAAGIGDVPPTCDTA